jgi:hypothetical protein
MSEASENSSLTAEGCYVALTSDHLSYQDIIDRVRSPEAGAIVLFAGTSPLSNYMDAHLPIYFDLTLICVSHFQLLFSPPKPL